MPSNEKSGRLVSAFLYHSCELLKISLSILSRSYDIDFGDGVKETAKSETLFASENAVVVHHSYKKYGRYDVSVIAMNRISETNITLRQAVRVFQRVSQVTVTAIHISKNNFDFLVDDFDALTFGEKHSGSVFGYVSI